MHRNSQVEAKCFVSLGTIVPSAVESIGEAFDGWIQIGLHEFAGIFGTCIQEVNEVVFMLCMYRRGGYSHRQRQYLKKMLHVLCDKK